MIETVKHPIFTLEDFNPAKKKRGISAILRLRNEEDFVEAALNSILPFFDEFVIVYNQCTDRTPEIVAQFAKREPQRVRVFHYLPEVFPQGSEQHCALPPEHVSSLVHYNNFALSKASYQVCIKCDGDAIAAPEPLRRVVDRLRGLQPGTLSWWRSPWKQGFWWGSGVNLWDEKGKIYVPQSRAKVRGKRDSGFWPMGRRHIFRYHPRFEVLHTRWLIRSFVGFLFFHVKGMKKDRGVGVYQFERNPNSPYKKIVETIWTNPELMTFADYCRIEPAARELPAPESLGIRLLQR
jgi:glycosyltransferase involved in cell wall biosynthesis